MNNLEKLATQDTRDENNQKWTIQRNWQHRIHETKTNKNEQSRETGNIGYTRRKQSKMDNLEKLATQDTRDENNQK